VRVRPDQIQALRDAQIALTGFLEGKVRHVATSAGVARYGKPIGYPIDGSPPVMYVPPRMLTREQADRVGRSWVYPSGKDTISRSLRTWLDTGQDRMIPALRRMEDVRDDDTVLTVGQLVRTVTNHGERKTTYRGLVMDPLTFAKMIETKQFDEPLGTSTTVQDLAWRFAQGDFMPGRLGSSDDAWIDRQFRVVMVLDGPALRLPNDNAGLNEDLGFNPEEHWVSGHYEITGTEKMPDGTYAFWATWKGALKPKTRKSEGIEEYEYDPSLDFGLWRYELTWPDQETKTAHRRVRDPEYWGMPMGTPIRPGMKPVLNVPNTQAVRTLPSGREWAQRSKADLVEIMRKRCERMKLDSIKDRIVSDYEKTLDDVVDAWQSPTGALVIIKDDATGMEIDGFIEVVDVLDMIAPTSDKESWDTQIIVDTEEISKSMIASIKRGHFDGFLMGLTSSWGNRIVVRGTVLKGRYSEDDGFHTPSAYLVPEPMSTLAHEWGHMVNHEQDWPANVSRRDIKKFMGDWSEYGQQNEHECIAEGFSEWLLSGGKSPIPEVQGLATLLHWRERFPRVGEFATDHLTAEYTDPEASFEADWMAGRDENWINDAEVTA
jgi:hypothetical protein